MIRKFFNYWSEPNKSHTKIRWELEETWYAKQRLTTWASRKPVNKETTSLKVIETESERQIKMAKEEKERDKKIIPAQKDTIISLGIKSSKDAHHQTMNKPKSN